MSIDELKKIIKDCGIVGAGGAGFPTHLKMDSRAKTIVLNCAECEPLLKVHQQLLAQHTCEILSALRKLSEILDVDIIIAIKKSYIDTIAAVNKAIEKHPRMRIALLSTRYPVGDEIILTLEALGIVIPPGTLPIESGCLVLNVETVYNIYNALEHGAAVTHKWVSITGEVAKPTTACIKIGTSIGEVIRAVADGATIENPAIISGGPMMGDLVSLSDTISKTTNALIVLPSDHYLIHGQKSNPSIDLNRVASACCQCRNCTDLCPRHLIGYPLEPHKIMRALSARDSTSEAFNGAMYCSMCGICEMVACPQSLAPRTLIKTFRKAMSEAGIKPQKCENSPVSDAFAYRKVDVNRLKIRLGLSKYD